MALINAPPLKEPVDPNGQSWSQWFMQVFRGVSYCGSGTTADRPDLKKLRPGDYYFDTSLGANGKPVFVRKDKAGWVLADGTAA